MEEIKEETILEIKKFIVPQLQPTRATQKANSLSPMVKRPLKGIKNQQPSQIPILNLKQTNQMPNSLTHIESNRNSQREIPLSKKYLNAPLSSASNTTKNSINTGYNTSRQTNWQETYSPSENFSKMVLRSDKKKQSLPALTPKNLFSREFDQQCSSLNYIKTISYIPEISKDEVKQNRVFQNATELDVRKARSQINFRANRRLDSQTDVSKFTAQQNSQITQSLNYIDDIESKNIFKKGKDEDFKIINTDILKEIFKEQYSEYQSKLIIHL